MMPVAQNMTGKGADTTTIANIDPTSSYNLIPQGLRQIKQWVLWRYEQREGKKTKMPYTIKDRLASSTNPTTWATFEEVLQCFLKGGYDGIGFVITKVDPYVGIDLDWKRYEGEDTPEEANTLLAYFNSYSELSPSLKGCHIFVKVTNKSEFPSGRKKKMSERVDIEVYPSGRFLTVTGLHIASTPHTIEDRSEALQTLYKTLFEDTEKRVQKSVRKQPLSLSDSQIIERAKAAKNGAAFTALWNGDTSAYASHSEADLALCTHLNFWTGGNAEAIDRLFRQSGLYREKWDKRHYGDGKTYGQATIEKALTGAVIEARDSSDSINTWAFNEQWSSWNKSQALYGKNAFDEHNNNSDKEWAKPSPWRR
jgi:putative DNA primase/helicase